jgi:hypothetical protein
VFAIGHGCMRVMRCVRLHDYRHKTTQPSSLVLTIDFPCRLDMLRYEICTRPNAPTRCGHAVDHLESCNHPSIIYRLCDDRLDRCAVEPWYSTHVHRFVRRHGQTPSKHGPSPHIHYFRRVTLSFLLEAFHSVPDCFRVCLHVLIGCLM